MKMEVEIPPEIIAPEIVSPESPVVDGEQLGLDVDLQAGGSPTKEAKSSKASPMSTNATSGTVVPKI